jgi:hypothetical protein
VSLVKRILVALFLTSGFASGEIPDLHLPADQSLDDEIGKKIHLAETPTIEMFFKAHCTKCHNPEKKKGGINFLKFTDFRQENAKHWQEALNNLQRGDMPPEKSIQPSIANSKVFVAQVLEQLDQVFADSDDRDFRFSRLTNSQIAWNLRDLLQIDRDFSGDLIEDPVGKHGESLQSDLELTAGHMEVYLSALQKAVELAVPDLNNPPKHYALKGNDWEKQHYLNRNDLAHGPRRKHRRYRGPKWLGDDFEVPVPPNHFFRIYVDDNRPDMNFRFSSTGDSSPLSTQSIVSPWNRSPVPRSSRSSATSSTFPGWIPPPCRRKIHMVSWPISTTAS